MANACIEQNEADINTITHFYGTICNSYRSIAKFKNSICVLQRWNNMDAFHQSSPRPDYDEESMRCAYIHKYAGIHAALIQKILLEFLPAEEQNRIFRDGSEEMKICCVGAGPCPDVMGILATLCRLHELPPKHYIFTSIDVKPGWQITHGDITRLLTDGQHGDLGDFYSTNAESTYVVRDVINPDEEISRILQSSDIIIMLKFLSELNESDAPTMLQNVLPLLKPNAVLLFVDNSFGGCMELLLTHVQQLNMEQLVYEDYLRYQNAAFHQVRHGMSSLYNDGLSVSFGMWRKKQGNTESQDCHEDKVEQEDENKDDKDGQGDKVDQD